MTYTENQQHMEQANTKVTTIGKAVKMSLMQAMEQDRIISGIFRCVDILERDADSVMVCILPVGKGKDASLRIQHTLIEAFCRENDVRCLKVDCPTKISTIFTSAASKDQKDRAQSADFSCLLVMHARSPSNDDQFVSDYCENFMLGGIVPHGCVEIPI
ncbi:growth arrest and DNA damage-inducible protein GADD45 alpha-like isoform X2 [Dreissena polymorpha]|uniref:Ribosomal protein L7Ae/L30e/S12e/Gadd45 domain-containing protein n=1 Tax=Dreissena polymorpha TaxID=45954 RepID=A0A9D4ENW3_DREPO|nr:growth arrest and DNA damage-inducible protein GADD45 alpha-like isoform X2 [Dreissena polymorpha]KAH3782728.1 hypothetical protein DPMN_160647 [Dreissena polymorpha]